MITKTWIINKKNLDEADLAWLRGCCNRIETTVLERPDFSNLVSSLTRRPMIMSGRAETTVETVSDAQESMLKLKYAEYLLLKTVIHDSGTPRMLGWI